MSDATVKCSYCGNDAELVGGESVYPHRPDLYYLKFYQCLPCDAWVGCHRGTTKPRWAGLPTLNYVRRRWRRTQPSISSGGATPRHGVVRVRTSGWRSKWVFHALGVTLECST